MYRPEKGLPNNCTVRVSGRAYAAPGERLPLPWLEHTLVVPVTAGLADGGSGLDFPVTGMTGAKAVPSFAVLPVEERQGVTGMAMAQVYGARPDTVEPVKRDARKAAGVERFDAFIRLARSISGASGVCLRIERAGSAQVIFSPAIDGVADLPPAMVRGEVAGQTDGTGLPGVQFWAGFPLRGADGTHSGLLGVMDATPRVLSQGVIGQLQLLADALAGVIHAEQAAARGLAERALRLVDDVTELDNEAASPSLRGLLRFAAGGSPNSTEAMALRIAGLAEAKAGKLVLTQVAEGILSHQGFDHADADADAGDDVAQAGAVETSAVDAGTDFVPMARLRIGEVSHLIARSEALGALGFRPGGGETGWCVLQNGLEEGWPEIIAEVLRETRDVVLDYVRMHMIHERDVTLPEGQYRYDLYGMGWTVRGTPDFAEVSVNGQDWTVFDASGVAWDQPRDLSARAALAGYPEIGTRIGTDVHEWCKRIAAGSEVTPIF